MGASSCIFRSYFDIIIEWVAEKQPIPYIKPNIISSGSPDSGERYSQRS